MAWYPDWPYRLPITSQNAKVSEAVTNAYIDLSELPSEFWDHVQNGGGDIRITQADGETEVARHVVSCDTGTSTGVVRFDCTGIQTSSDVVWYIYYGNAGASDYAEDAEFGREAVYDANYRATYPMNDLTTSTIQDATAADLDGAKLSANNPIESAAQVGKGQLYSSDYIHNLGGVADFKFLHGAEDVNNFKTTISFWMSNTVAEPNALRGLVSTGQASTSVVGIDFWFDDRASVPRSRRISYNINRGVSGQAVCTWLSGDNE